MNIGYICADFSIPIFGDLDSSYQLRRMAESFCQLGHSVCVVSPASDRETVAGFGERHERIHENGKIHYLPVLPEKRHVELDSDFKRLQESLGIHARIEQQVKSLFFNLTLFDRAADFLEDHKVDFIYEHFTPFSCSGVRLAKHLNIPHFLEIDKMVFDQYQQTARIELPALALDTKRHVLRDSDHIFVTSGELLEHLCTQEIERERISVVPPSLPALLSDDTNSQRERIRNQLNLNGRCVIGLFDDHESGLQSETLLKALRQIHERQSRTHALVIGNQPHLNDLKKFALEYGLEDCVSFVDITDDLPQRALLAAMDMIVMSGSRQQHDREAGLRIATAMLMSKPLISNRDGAQHPFMIDGKTAMFFESGNACQLAAILEELAGNMNEGRVLGERAKNWLLESHAGHHGALHVIELARTMLADSKRSRQDYNAVEF